MKEEIDSLKQNITWLLVPKPKRQKIMGCKWIYRIKEGTTKLEPRKFKTKLVEKGFTQIEGADYSKVFSPVVKMKTIRMTLALAIQFEWEVEQIDVKTTFLNG